MKKLLRISSFIIICLVSLLITQPVAAFPPLPSSFYGKVKIDGENVPDGTLVEALIGGEVFAQAETQTYQGDSVYTLDVPGDDGSTTDLEGGVENDAITFRIGGVAANQTGAWKSGTNVNLDLSNGASESQSETAATAIEPTQAQPQPLQADTAASTQPDRSQNQPIVVIIIVIIVGFIAAIILWQIFTHRPKGKS